ncbi:hypothetical protein OK074_3344 [Actinobacteria bacterium OK074]|nr:hypothetical protein OK074_3344 [Actinobacteria bacterium OK074]
MNVRGQLGGRFIQMISKRLLRDYPPSPLSFPELVMAEKRVHRVATDAGEVTCTSYHPASERLPTSGLPGVYVNSHGGGYVLRRPEQDDALCRYVAHRAGCVVLNVDYDVAPQKPFPTPVEQVYGVCRWAADEAGDRGWDGSRLAIGGQSAGGALTAAVSRLARERRHFTPRLQALVYPPLDLAVDPETKRSLTDKPLITPGLSRIFTAAYVPDPATRTNPLVSPVTADDLAGLPPALVITAELDTLRDEGDRYAKALEAAGVPVTHRVISGVDHSFTHHEPVGPAVEGLALIARMVREALTA